MVGELTEREAQAIKWIENRHRAQLNPIEEANALKALAEEWELVAQKDIAANARIKPQEVGLLLRLLELPKGVQRLIASGDVPVKAEKRLRNVAAVSPRIAVCVSEFAKREEVTHIGFVRSFNSRTPRQ